MFDLGWTELLVIGVVALIVVGPKDLPGLFRSIGRFTGKARAMAREFSAAMNAAADESGVRDIDRTIRAAASPAKAAGDALRDTASSIMKPGGATEALAKSRKEAAAKLKEQVAARSSDADTATAEAPAPAEKAAPAKTTKTAKTAKPASPARPAKPAAAAKPAKATPRAKPAKPSSKPAKPATKAKPAKPAGAGKDGA